MTSGSNLGWEVAGSKKLSKKPDTNQKQVKNGKPSKEEASKIPKLETLPPLKPDSTIYDLIRESDSDYDSDEINNNKKNQQKKSTSVVQDKVQDSPKKAERKQKQESLNLLQSSIATAQKKKPITSGTKNTETELEAALSELKIEEFEKESNNLVALFSNDILLINQHLSSFLNQKLNHIAEVDPSSNHENESTFPMNKLDKNVLKFFNTNLSKLNKQDTENLFEFCFKSLFTDSSKVQSVHGYKIVIQIISKQNPNLSVNNLTKLNEIINLNKHRHQRCLISLWALAQSGYYSLQNGVKIWFDSMLNYQSIKGCTNFALSYLHSLLQHHKIDSKSKLNDQTLTFDQYSKLNELANDKTLNLNKDVQQKLKQTSETFRSLYKQNLSTQQFEILFKNLPTDQQNNSKQSDLLDLLTECLFTNKDSLSKWKQIYSKYLLQSLAFLEHLSSNHMKSFKSLRDTRDCLKYFEQHSNSVLSKINPKEHSTKTHHFNRSKTTKSAPSETDLLKKFNKLVQNLLNHHFKQISVLSMVLRSLFITTLIVGLFFYWDINQNKSVYTNSVQRELKKYGLLEPILNVIDSVRNLLLTVQKLIVQYVPIWYKKTRQTLEPVFWKVYEHARVYANLAWIKSEPYRDLVVLYTNQSVDFLKLNYPIFVKNLVSCMELVVNYLTTLSQFCLYYLSQLADFVGVKLIGWKHGELEQIFLDAFKILLEKLALALQHLNNFLNQN